MFNVNIEEELFNSSLPSMGIDWGNTPAFCCHLGLIRMAEEFKRYPQQFEINIKKLEDENNEELTGAKLLCSTCSWCEL